MKYYGPPNLSIGLRLAQFRTNKIWSNEFHMSRVEAVATTKRLTLAILEQVSSQVGRQKFSRFVQAHVGINYIKTNSMPSVKFNLVLSYSYPDTQRSSAHDQSDCYLLHQAGRRWCA